MRALQVIVGAAAVLATVVGCGQSDQGAPASQPSSSSVVVSATVSSGLPSVQPSNLPAPAPIPSLPQGGTPLPKNQVDVSGLPPFYAQQEVVVAPDGYSVTVIGMARDSCSSVQGQVVQETPELVHIQLSPMPAPQGGPPDKVCTQVLTEVPVTVRLKAPLGNRRVIVTEKETY